MKKRRLKKQKPSWEEKVKIDIESLMDRLLIFKEITQKQSLKRCL